MNEEQAVEIMRPKKTSPLEVGTKSSAGKCCISTTNRIQSGKIQALREKTWMQFQPIDWLSRKFTWWLAWPIFAPFRCITTSSCDETVRLFVFGDSFFVFTATCSWSFLLGAISFFQLFQNHSKTRTNTDPSTVYFIFLSLLDKNDDNPDLRRVGTRKPLFVQ